jgi:hypothetical protein
MDWLMDELGHHPPFFQHGTPQQYHEAGTGEIYLQPPPVFMRNGYHDNYFC